MSQGPRHLNPGAGGMTRRSLLPGSGREMTRARTWQRGEKQIRRGLGSRAGGSWPRRVRQKKVASWFQTWAVAQGTAEGALSVTSALGCEVSEARPGRKCPVVGNVVPQLGRKVRIRGSFIMAFVTVLAIASTLAMGERAHKKI